jgi:hypothetical protein
VVGVEVGGRMEWFEKVHKAKPLVALHQLPAPKKGRAISDVGDLPQTLCKRRVKDHAGRAPRRNRGIPLKFGPRWADTESSDLPSGNLLVPTPLRDGEVALAEVKAASVRYPPHTSSVRSRPTSSSNTCSARSAP